MERAQGLVLSLSDLFRRALRASVSSPQESSQWNGWRQEAASLEARLHRLPLSLDGDS